jgi:hypothetical protein
MVAGVVAAVVLALTVAVSASAYTTGTATLAPVGAGSYELTVTNTGTETITSFLVVGGHGYPIPTNIVPSPACGSDEGGYTPGSILCRIAIAPGASTQMCYTGGASPEVDLDTVEIVKVAAAPAVGSCALAGFSLGSPSGSGSGGAGAATKCVVPKLKGKKLASAEKAITQAHCAVGKVKKAGSKHVKKGSVISQSQTAGKSLPSGTKVSLVVSKG